MNAQHSSLPIHQTGIACGITCHHYLSGCGLYSSTFRCMVKKNYRAACRRAYGFRHDSHALRWLGVTSTRRDGAPHLSTFYHLNTCTAFTYFMALPLAFTHARHSGVALPLKDVATHTHAAAACLHTHLHWPPARHCLACLCALPAAYLYSAASHACTTTLPWFPCVHVLSSPHAPLFLPARLHAPLPCSSRFAVAWLQSTDRQTAHRRITM